MPAIHLGPEIKIVRLSIPLVEFPSLLARHAKESKSSPPTPIVEELAADYVASDFHIDQTENFVRNVCRWGNYAGVAGKVLKHNDLSEIRARLKASRAALSAGDPKEAIEQVTSIKGLAVSFGSKHLKFLDPDRAAVLDSIISTRLGYLPTPDGYAEFLADCYDIRDILNESKILASEHRASWRVSDVEMAIFMKLWK